LKKLKSGYSLTTQYIFVVQTAKLRLAIFILLNVSQPMRTQFFAKSQVAARDFFVLNFFDHPKSKIFELSLRIQK
jgi:hypothetical protein